MIKVVGSFVKLLLSGPPVSTKEDLDLFIFFVNSSCLLYALVCALFNELSIIFFPSAVTLFLLVGSSFFSVASAFSVASTSLSSKMKGK